jgi:hypothetical protein
VIFAVLIAAFLAGLAAGGYGMSQWDAGVAARHEKEQLEAQAAIDAKAREERAKGQKQIDDAVKAYEKAEADARAKAKIVYIKAQDYVTTTPVLTDPRCALPLAGVQLLNSALAAVRSTSDTAGSPATMSFGTPLSGAPAAGGGTVSGSTAATGTVDDVHPAPRQAGGSGQVPAGGVRPPKPKPVR